MTSYTLIYTHAQLTDCEASRKAYGLSSFARYKGYGSMCVCLFWISDLICPTGSTPKGEPTESSPNTQATRIPRALSLYVFPTCSRTFVMHPDQVRTLPCPPVLYQYTYVIYPAKYHSIYIPGGGGGGALGYLGGCIRSLSKLKNTPKALISGQKSTLILIKR